MVWPIETFPNGKAGKLFVRSLGTSQAFFQIGGAALSVETHAVILQGKDWKEGPSVQSSIINKWPRLAAIKLRQTMHAIGPGVRTIVHNS